MAASGQRRPVIARQQIASNDTVQVDVESTDELFSAVGLAEIVEAWPILPDYIRLAIPTLAQSTKVIVSDSFHAFNT